MLLLRRIVFYVFVALYLFLCPLVISYALGYWIRPGTVQGLVKTGLISLSTSPRGATVYVGKSRYTQQTPTVLRDMLPGQYLITLVLAHHKPWRHLMPVEAERATALDHILLLPESVKPRQLLSGPFDDVVPLSGTELFLLVPGSHSEPWVVYNWREETAWPLLPDDAVFREARILSYFTADESQALLLHVRTKDGERFVWLEGKEPQPHLEDLTNLFLGRPRLVTWDSGAARHLFVFQHGYLNRVDRISKAMVPRFLEHVRGFGVFQKSLYVLRDGPDFFRMDEEGRHQDSLLHELEFDPRFFGGKGVFQIKVVSKDLILFWGEQGELLANRLADRVAEKGVLGLAVDPERERVLFWQKDRLGLLEPFEGSQEIAPFKEDIARRWIFERGERIQQAFWVYEGSHVLFRDGNQVLLFPLEASGAPDAQGLVRVKRHSSVGYVERTGTLYYLDESTGNLSSIEVLPP